MSTGTIPRGSRTQKLENLEKANAVRTGNAQLRNKIRAMTGREAFAYVAGLIECPEGHVAAMPIGRLLVAIERVGYHRMSKWLTLIGVRSIDRRLDELTDRQRMVLASTLREAGARH